MVGNECRCVAFLLLVLAVFAVGAEHGVVIRALVVEDVEEIEALGAAVHVPFAYHCCGVPRFL